MDNLAGLTWTSPASATRTDNDNDNRNRNRNRNAAAPHAYPVLKPTPPPPHLSARSTPAAPKPVTQAADSFSSLLGGGAGGKVKAGNDGGAGMTMMERQRELVALRAREEEERRRVVDAGFGVGIGGAGAGAGWEVFGARADGADGVGRGASLLGGGGGSGAREKARGESVGDLLAGFGCDVPVDRRSHFPPDGLSSGRSTPAMGQPLNSDGFRLPGRGAGTGFDAPRDDDDDDDPFGLGSMPRKEAVAPAAAVVADDDDVLGLLGRPVAPKPIPLHRPTSPVAVDDASDSSSDSDSPPASRDPRDRAVAELVDMGFPADKAAQALLHTDYNVSAAVGFLLNTAHEEARQKARSNDSSRRPTPRQDLPDDDMRRPSRRDMQEGPRPAWMAEARSQSGSRRQDESSPARDKDVSQFASELGTSFLKSANSLWKTSKKNVAKAVADFNQEPGSTFSDPSQPKWMRDAMTAERNGSRQQGQPDKMTDEAMALESDGRPQKAAKQPQQHQQQRQNGFKDGPRDFSQARADSRFADVPSRPASRPEPLRSRPSPAPATSVPSSRGFKFDDDAADEVYTSSSRRRTPASGPSRTASPAPSQFSASTSQAPANASSSAPRAVPQASRPLPRPSPSITPRPKAPPRQIPPISPSALATSASHRATGSEAFKRGDYAAAHTSYSSALASLAAPLHPIAIVILCNRAATSLKTGDPRAAIGDADEALRVIGPGLGQDESIGLGEGERGMREFYGKALMRKAEGLEHLEKWADALAVWKLAVEAGLGGSVSMQGRQRCEKASGGGGAGVSNASRPAAASAPPPKRAPAAKAPPRVPPSRAPASHAASAEAVAKLRAANAAAERADDEKFALADAVDAKLAAWKGSKSDNLRALLGTLDAVLWPEAGWKKVGMGELVVPNRVKVVYMRAIGKVHPDKDATTEQRMISSAVFGALNQAWDKFKTENGL